MRNFKSPINRSFALLCFETTHWQICWFISYYFTTPAQKDFIVRLAFMVILFVPFTYYHFIVQFLRVKKEILWSKVFYFISLIWLILIWTTKWFIVGYQQFWWGYYPKAGFLYLFYLGIAAIAIVRTLILLSRVNCDDSIPANIRNQNKFVLLAAWFYCFASIEYLIDYGVAIYPIGVFFILCSFTIIAYAILKYRLMDIRIAITRAGIFLVVYTFVLGIPFWIGYQTKTWAIPTSLAIILATIGPIVYRAIQKKAEGILLAKQKHYQKVLLDAAKGMALEHNLNRLLNLIVHVVKRAVKIEYAAIFIEEKERQRYCLRVVRDHHKVVDTFMIANTHVLIEIIRKKREAIRYEDIPKAERNILGLPMHLVVPSMIKERLLGFLVLGEKEDRTIYTEDDVGVFDVLSRQAALAIEHCIFLEEFRKAQEKLFQAEKLASIGGMADGVAHQIRNRLNSFAVAVGEQIYELKDFKERKAEFIEQNQDLKNTIEYVNKAAEHIDKEVQRTAKIIDGILNYARVEEKEIFFSEFSFKEIVENAVNLVSIKHQVAEIPVEVEIDKGGDIIYGVKAQVMESIYNIIDNAYEAIVEKERNNLSEGDRSAFKAFIRVKFSVRLNRSYIEIEDNGIGVKEENKAKIFAPFFTTKSSYISGTGIGMYVVKRMIEENHNGKIWFSSEYKKGTTFYIELPRKKAGK